jgi:hypothetical protein
VESAVVVLVIVALWVLGSLVPTGHTVPQEIASLKRPQRLHSPYTKEDLRVIYRIWATWRVEHLPPRTDALTQRFETFKDLAPRYETRKMS